MADARIKCAGPAQHAIYRHCDDHRSRKSQKWALRIKAPLLMRKNACRAQAPLHRANYPFALGKDWITAMPEAEGQMPVILITGGARSGKSTRAEARTREFSGKPVYIATAKALDEEMGER